MNIIMDSKHITNVSAATVKAYSLDDDLSFSLNKAYTEGWDDILGFIRGFVSGSSEVATGIASLSVIAEQFRDSFFNVDNADRIVHTVHSIVSEMAPIKVAHNITVSVEAQTCLAMAVLLWHAGHDTTMSRFACIVAIVWLLSLLARSEPCRALLKALKDRLFGDGAETQGMHDMVLPVVTALVMAPHVARHYTDFNTDAIVEMFDNVTRASQTISSIKVKIGNIDNIFGFIEDLVNSISSAMGSDWILNLTGRCLVELDAIRKEVIELEEIALGGNVMDMRAIRSRVEALFDRLNAISLKKLSREHGAYPQVYSRLNKLRDNLRSKGAYAKVDRNEPYFVIFSGPPGVGKSTIAQVTMDVLTRELFSDGVFQLYCENPSASIWSPNQNDNFDSGYQGQPIIMVDDMGFDKEANKAFLPKLIHLVNSMPMATNQAALEDKGNIFMAAELIIATSNITNWPNVAKTMSEPDALLRRMHATIHISCKPEYAKPDGTMDWSIVDAYIKASNGKVRVEDCFWMDIHEYDPRNGQIVEVGHSMRSLLDKLVSTMNARRNHNDKTAARTRQFRSALSRVDYRTLYPLSSAESMELQVMDKNPLSIFTEGPDLPMAPGVPGAWPSECNRHCLFHFPRYVPTDDLDHCRNCGLSTKDNLPRVKVQCTALSTHCTVGSLGCANPATGTVQWCDRAIAAWNIHYMRQVAKVEKFAGSMSEMIIQNIKDTARELWSNFASLTAIALNELRTVLQFNPAITCLAGWAVIMLLMRVWQWRSERKSETAMTINQAETESNDDNARALCDSLLSNNVVGFMEGETMLCVATAITHELIFMNGHNYDKLLMRNGGKRYTISLIRCGKKAHLNKIDMQSTDLLVERNVHRFPDADLIALRVPKFVCKDIKAHFGDLPWTPAVTRQVSLAFWQMIPGTMHPQREVATGPARGFKDVVRATDAALGKDYCTSDAISYDIATRKGMCGSPIVVLDKNVQAKIVGIHCAGYGGNTTLGIAVRVTRKMIDAAIEALKPAAISQGEISPFAPIVVQASDWAMEKVDIDKMPNTPYDDCMVVGTTHVARPAYRSDIGKSPMHGIIQGAESLKKPARLVPKDGVDPVLKNVVEYSKGYIVPPTELLRGAEVALLTHYTSLEPPKINRFLTFEEAVAGTPLLPNMKPIDRGTSCGFPDRLFLGHKKRSAFGEEGDFVFDTVDAQLIKEQVELIMENAASAAPAAICAVFPKDELRPNDRVRDCKTRLIMAAPVSHLIATRMVFGSFVDWWLEPKNRLRNFTAMGINMADEIDLKAYADRLGAGHPDYRVMAGDHSGYDKKLSPFLMDHLFNIFDALYGKTGLYDAKQMLIARNLFIGATRPCIQYDDRIVQWTNSNPSGWLMTTQCNSATNTLATYIACAHAVLGPDATRMQVTDFVTKVINNDVAWVIDFGDDVTVKVKRGVNVGYNLDMVNDTTLAKGYATMGLVYTDEDKNEEFQNKDRNLFDISFLKRTIRMDRELNRPVAMLDLSTIIQNIQWMKRPKDGTDPLLVWETKLDRFLDELAIHHDQTWDEWYPRIVEAYQSAALGLPRRNVSFSLTREERKLRWCSSDLTM